MTIFSQRLRTCSIKFSDFQIKESVVKSIFFKNGDRIVSRVVCPLSLGAPVVSINMQNSA